MTHLLSVLSWTQKRAGSWEAKRSKSGGWETVRNKCAIPQKGTKIPSSPDLIITSSVSLKTRVGGGKKRESSGWYCLCVENQIDCGEICTKLLYVKFVIPGQPTEHPSSLGLTRPCLSSPDMSCLQTVPAGQLTGVILVFTAVTVQWRSMPMYRTLFPWLEKEKNS